MIKKYYIVRIFGCKLMGFTRNWYFAGHDLKYVARETKGIWEKINCTVVKHWYTENLRDLLKINNCVKEITAQEATAIILRAEPAEHDY